MFAGVVLDGDSADLYVSWTPTNNTVQYEIVVTGDDFFLSGVVQHPTSLYTRRFEIPEGSPTVEVCVQGFNVSGTRSRGGVIRCRALILPSPLLLPGDPGEPEVEVIPIVNEPAPLPPAVRDLAVHCGGTWCDLTWRHIDGVDAYVVWRLQSEPWSLIADAGTPPAPEWPDGSPSDVTWEVLITGDVTGTIEAKAVTDGACAYPVVPRAPIGYQMTCRVDDLDEGRTYNWLLRSMGGEFFPSVAGEGPPPPGVTDLAVVSTTSSTVTVGWTQVADGMGQPASYAVRWVSPHQPGGWWATGFPNESIVYGSAVGAPLSITLAGYDDGQEVSVRIIPFRGVLMAGSVFGPVSGYAIAETGS